MGTHIVKVHLLPYMPKKVPKKRALFCLNDLVLGLGYIEMCGAIRCHLK